MAVLARLSWLGIARETAPGMATLPTAAVPVSTDGYEPEDTPAFLFDTGLRSSMGQVAGAVQTTLGSVSAFGGPFYPDSGGWWLDNLLGDLSTIAGVSAGNPGALLSSPVNIGDTSLTVGGSLGSVQVGSVVQISDGAASEVVTATAGSTGTTVNFTGTPCRFPHTIAASATLVSAPLYYAHTFSALNNGTGQPPTHTLTDTTGLTAGTLARAYPAAAVTQIDFAGDPGKGWITAKASVTAWLSQPSAATAAYPPTAYVAPFGGWQATVLAGGTVAYAGPWAASLKRQTVIYRSAGNPQNPYVIARGPLTATGAFGYPDPSDETPLTQMLSAGLIPVRISASNGLSGAGALSLTLSFASVQFAKAKPDREMIALGYGTAWQAVDSSSNAGGSGGISPVQVTLTNGVAAY